MYHRLIVDHITTIVALRACLHGFSSSPKLIQRTFVVAAEAEVHHVALRRGRGLEDGAGTTRRSSARRRARSRRRSQSGRAGCRRSGRAAEPRLSLPQAAPMSARRRLLVPEAEVEGIIVISVGWSFGRSRSARSSAVRAVRSWAGGGGDARADHGAVPPRLRQEDRAPSSTSTPTATRTSPRSWWCPSRVTKILHPDTSCAMRRPRWRTAVGMWWVLPPQEEPRLTHEEAMAEGIGRRRRRGGDEEGAATATWAPHVCVSGRARTAPNSQAAPQGFLFSSL